MYDLIVAGGGFAGVSAAVSAARCGLSVLLIEKGGSLGGAACNAYVNPFMPYKVNIDGEIRKISDGIFAEILENLDKMGGLAKNRVTFSEEILKLVFDDMCEKAGVNVLFHAYLSSVSAKDGKIESVTVSTKGGPITLGAFYFIDATGDADLSVLSGCSYNIGRETDHQCQPMTLCFRLAGIDKEKFDLDAQKEANELYMKLLAEGKMRNPRENILLFPYESDGVVHFNTTRVIKKCPVDAFDVSAAEREARLQVYEMFKFLKENARGCENATLLSTAPEIGVRQSRQIQGEYILNTDDLKSLTKFPDRIAASNYEIDIHSPDGSGTSHYFFGPGEYYTIPYRSLIPREIKNLIVAGRCISSTFEAQASYRIMPVCATLGQAAGIAASVCKEKGCNAIDADISLIQEKLIAAGAFIG